MAVNRSMGEAVAQAGKLSATPLEGVQACVFDAYGTLFDYASAAARCRDALPQKTPARRQRAADVGGSPIMVTFYDAIMHHI